MVCLGGMLQKSIHKITPNPLAQDYISCLDYYMAMNKVVIIHNKIYINRRVMLFI